MATLSVRTSLSIQHVEAAARFAREALAIEATAGTNHADTRWQSHRYFVVASFFASAAFLEAVINEVFADAVDHRDGIVSGLPETVLNELARIRVNETRPAFERRSTVGKYQVALKAAGAIRFREDRGICSDVLDLLAIRNLFVHYVPEWDSSIPRSHGNVTASQALQSRFAQRSIAVHPLTIGTAAPFLPQKCTSHGFAEWGIQRCIEFVRRFFQKLQVPLRYESQLSEIHTR